MALAVTLAFVVGGTFERPASGQTVIQIPVPIPTGKAKARTNSPNKPKESAPVPVPQEDEGEGRQVTLFGVIAVPGGGMDPKLASIQPQLNRLLPGYGFRLLAVRSKRLTEGQNLEFPLGNGLTASTTLLQSMDEDGKVRLRASVLQGQVPQLVTLVHTPPNQLFFCDKLFPDGSRLLIGVGAR